jgi:hypothetical protein
VWSESVSLPVQYAVGNALSSDLRHGKSEAVRIVLVFAIVEAKDLFVNVSIEMKRFHSNVGSAQGSLQERPRVFQAIRVGAPSDISLGMIHNVMHKAITETFVSDRIIRINGRAIFNISQHLVLQGLALDVWNYRSSDFASVTVEDALHDCFPL